MNSIEKKIANLRNLIEKYNNEYYNNNNSLINDDEYDYLIKKLEKLEQTFPNYQDDTSPTKSIAISNSLMLKNKHYIKVQSLKNIFEFEEIEKFFKKNSKYLINKQIEYIYEYKIDGLSIIIEYLNGILIKASTRGDGYFGEDVTKNILKIKDIPKRINLKKRLIIRGEIYITKKNFEILNNFRINNNLSIFSNPRNTASGALRNINMDNYYKLSCVFFNIENNDEFNFKSDEECLLFLKTLNLNIIDFYKLTKNINPKALITKLFNSKQNLEYNVDGIVIKINILKDRAILGSNSKYPRWAVAFKNKTKIVDTKIIGILNQVGRSGVISPIAILEPVLLDGTIIKKATLHNYSYIEKKDIRINDIVQICKAGEIIPKILSVNLKMRNKSSLKTLLPKYCPICNNLLCIINKKRIICKNLNCVKQLETKICHYISSDGMDIKFLGKNTIRLLIENKILNSINDLYNLNINDLCLINGIKYKKANKIIESINFSKECYLKNFIYSLGINNVGKQAANSLALYFKKLDNFLNTTIDELLTIRNFGNQIANNIIIFLQNNDNINLIRKLNSNILIKKFNLSQKTFLYNKNIVITGTLKKYNRNSLINILTNNYGAFVSKNISKKTNILIVGNNPGSKLKKAKLFNINIIDEYEIYIILNNK